MSTDPIAQWKYQITIQKNLQHGKAMIKTNLLSLGYVDDPINLDVNSVAFESGWPLWKPHSGLFNSKSWRQQKNWINERKKICYHYFFNNKKVTNWRLLLAKPSSEKVKALKICESFSGKVSDAQLKKCTVSPPQWFQTSILVVDIVTTRLKLDWNA